MSDLFQIGTLRESISRSFLRHKVISNNIANVNTVGYKARDVVFDQELDKAENAADPSHSVVKVEGLVERADGNNVDIDLELGKLNKNSMLLQSYTQILTSRIRLYRSAMTTR